MKKLIPLLLISLLLGGCITKEELKKQEKPIDIEVIMIDDVEFGLVKSSDNCQYLVRKGYQTEGIMHYQFCNNPQHNPLLRR